MFVSTRGLAPMFSNRSTKNRLKVLRCQCPLGLIPHFYRLWKLFKHDRSYWVCQCPLGLIPHFYIESKEGDSITVSVCQCPLGLIPHFYYNNMYCEFPFKECVNALSGLYLISTSIKTYIMCLENLCQCPLGLIPHFYGTPSKT